MPRFEMGAYGRRSAGVMVSRRGAIRVGSLGLAGLSLEGLLRLRAASAGSAASVVPAPGGRAKSAILLFLSGGPAHMDMWDMKPDAPEDVRGTFRPIETNVAGIQICEHLPRMARVMDKCAIVRSVHHAQGDHPAAAYWMMVGSPIGRPTREAGMMSRADRPHPGSVVAKVLGPQAGGVPPFVMVPEAIQPNGPERSGQFAGFLGAAFDPYRINSDPNLADYTPGELRPPEGLDAARIAERRRLLEAIAGASDLAVGDQGGLAARDEYFERAFELVGSVAAQRAFEIEAEPAAVRDRYGRHVFGQSVLLARRMVEAGVRLVQVNWVRHDGGKGAQGYDTHRNHLELTRRDLLPATDAAFASLVEDLEERGLLDETLVIMMGEFGRTPRFNKDGGRDHWPKCFSLVMAGGGIRGGCVHGASDKIAAYPVVDPVTPQEVIATLYHALGVDPGLMIYDQQDRPYRLVEGEPVWGIL